MNSPVLSFEPGPDLLAPLSATWITSGVASHAPACVSISALSMIDQTSAILPPLSV